MYRLQLQSVLQSDPFTSSIYQGIYPIDKLPKSIQHFPAAIIANTDESNESGEHWVAFYFTSKHTAEFFDSYGNAAHTIDPRFTMFMEKVCAKNHRFLLQYQKITRTIVKCVWTLLPLLYFA